MSELTELKRKSPGFREKVVLFRVKLLHSHKPQAEQVFPCQYKDSRIMVDFLLQIHSEQGLRLYLSVSPPQIPVAPAFFSLNHPT